MEQGNVCAGNAPWFPPWRDLPRRFLNHARKVVLNTRG